MNNTIPEAEVPMPLAPEERIPVMEACLFAAGHPLSYERLADVMHVTVSECRETARQMADLYNRDEPYRRGILLILFPDSCQLCTREVYAEEIKTALGIRRGGKLSQSLLEVLAVAAYNQPVTRSFVDTVRGVDSSYAIGALIEKNLLEPCGKLDAPGRPTLYRTTTDFLRIFGLEDLTELPPVTVHGASGEVIELEPDTEDLDQISMTETAEDPTDETAVPEDGEPPETAAVD